LLSPVIKKHLLRHRVRSLVIIQTELPAYSQENNVSLFGRDVEGCSIVHDLKYCSLIYRVINKSFRDFRPLWYSSRDGQAEGEHADRGRDTPSFCPTLQVLDMSNLAPSQLTQFRANSNTQNAFLFSVHAMFRHDCPLTVKPANAPWRQYKKKTWRDSAPIYMFLSVVSVCLS
jgi:hypothetical protein